MFSYLLIHTFFAWYISRLLSWKFTGHNYLHTKLGILSLAIFILSIYIEYASKFYHYVPVIAFVICFFDSIERNRIFLFFGVLGFPKPKNFGSYSINIRLTTLGHMWIHSDYFLIEITGFSIENHKQAAPGSRIIALFLPTRTQTFKNTQRLPQLMHHKINPDVVDISCIA